MLEKIKNNLPTIISILIYLAVFTSLLFPYRDKDWGWHYKYGESVVQKGEIVRKDTFTWSMKGYSWVNHSWTFDPTLYTLFNTTGYLGLSLVNASIALFCFWLLASAAKLKYFDLGVFAFFFVQLTETGFREGLRSQVIALIPLTILIYLLRRIELKPKLAWWLPLLFLCFANIHGTFVFGMGVLGLWMLYYWFTAPKYRLLWFAVTLLSFFATLINPFGGLVYGEVLRHANNPYLHNVFEWIGITYNCPDCHVPTFSLYTILFVIAIFSLGRKVIKIPYIALALLLGFESLSARRYEPLFAIVTLPLFAEYLPLLTQKLSVHRLTPYLVALAALITIEYNLFTRLPADNFYHYSERDYCFQASACSVDLMSYLDTNPPVGRGFNFYDWGGYLIGKEVKTPIFLDGRMHVWQARDYQPFGDYIEMYYNNNGELFSSYAFDWLIIPSSGGMVNSLKSNKQYGIWHIRYQDQYALYLTRTP